MNQEPSMSSRPLPPGVVPALRTVPWWRVPIAWLALGLPVSAVVAATASAVIAVRHADPVVAEARASAAPSAQSRTLQPAELARNHAATPRR
jgi:hypothetical protein